MLTRGDVDRVEFDAARGRLSHADAAHRYERAAADLPPATTATGDWIWDDDAPVTRADLLVAAGAQHALAGDIERARDTYAVAVGAGATSMVDARAYLVGALIELGDPGADPLLRELLASRSTDPFLYEYVGEALELHRGDLAAALRWFTAGVTRCVPLGSSPEPGDSAAMLLVARRRVRHALGFPPDEWDEDAELVQRTYGRDPADE